MSIPAIRPLTFGLVFGAVLLGHVLIQPWFVVRRDHPGRYHTSLGMHPIWRPPTREEGHRALVARFPTMPAAALESLDLRVNRIRIGLHVALSLGALGALALILRRRTPRAPH